MTAIDLTPFGFTPTESLAFDALLELGPASGYAVAKHIGVARANAYQALNGLVGKGAASLIEENPQRFRAVKPEAMLTMIASTEAGKLATLEQQVRERGGADGDHAIVPVEGERAFLEMVTRSAGREAGPVWCVAPQALLDQLQPIWRKRDADGSANHLTAAPDGVVLFASSAAAIIAGDTEPLSGHWFSEPAIIATVRHAVEHINQTVG